MNKEIQTLKLNYNSTYISINLIDELDYVLGGYGKAAYPFVYTLNAFIESFILNGHFYITDQEVRHAQLTSKAFFPEGRPALDLLYQTGSLSIIGGIAQPVGKVVFIRQLKSKTSKSITAAVKAFQQTLAGELRGKYLILPETITDQPSLKHLVAGGFSDGIAITEHSNSPEEIVKKLNENLHHTHVQVTLPVYTYDFQIQELQGKGLSREILWQLTGSFVKEQDKLRRYLGFTQQAIPPLVPILFSQCRSMADIPGKLIQLRADFQELRDSIQRFERNTGEAGTIKEQMEAVQELDEFWEVLNRKYPQKNNRLLYRFWDVAKDAGYEKTFDTALTKGSLDGVFENLNLGSIAGKSTRKLLEWYRDRKILNRFKGVTDIWELFQKGPALTNQLREIERIFKVEFTQAEIEEAIRQIEQLRKARSLSA